MYRARAFVFLTPKALGRRRYRRVCSEFGLEPVPSGYGALLCHDDEHREITELTPDPGYLSTIVSSLCELHRLRQRDTDEPARIDEAKFPLARAGWPTRQCRGM